jgi:DNA-binding NtrC family response regulator
MDTLSEPSDAARPPRSAAKHPALFEVLRASDPRRVGLRHCLHDVYMVEIHRRHRRQHDSYRRHDGRLTLELDDQFLSAVHARLRLLAGRWNVEDAGSKNGTFVNGVSVSSVRLQDGDVLTMGGVVFRYREHVVAADCSHEPYDPVAAAAHPQLASQLPRVAAGFARLAQLARSTVSVFISGETGTGKEAVARAVHQLSGRSGPFVAINCGAIPPTLVESELFGCTKGAFSGALDRPGMIRATHGGTLFLDEVGELPLAAQVTLLRVLQERCVVPVGGTTPIPVDFRVCAATHQNMEQLVAAGGFRADLLARLDGHLVRLPPLRQRREDLGLIIASVLARVRPGESRALSFARQAAERLVAYDWPSNIRELEKCLEVSLAFADAGRVRLHHLPERISGERGSHDSSEPGRAPTVAMPHGHAAEHLTPVAPPELSLAEGRLRDQLLASLREHDGNVSAVAREFGKHQVQIRRWMKRFGLTRPPLHDSRSH